MPPATQEDVLAFWFGDCGADGLAAPEVSKRWFTKDDAFDADIRARFQPLYEALVGGAHQDWQRDARGALAAVIVLDQFPRNMFRGTPRMYAADDQAVAIADHAIAQGFDRELPGDLRAFFYLPLMHAEDRVQQRRCCELFAQYLAEARTAGNDQLAERLENNLKFADWHRDIVERFERFPHRNAIVGRKTTQEEAKFLSEPNSSF